MRAGRHVVPRPIEKERAIMGISEIRSQYSRAVGKRPKISVTCRLQAHVHDYVMAWATKNNLSFTMAVEQIVGVVMADNIPKQQF